MGVSAKKGCFLLASSSLMYAFNIVAAHTGPFRARLPRRWRSRPRIIGNSSRVSGSCMRHDSVGPRGLSLGEVARTVGRLLWDGLSVRVRLPVNGIGRVATLRL